MHLLGSSTSFRSLLSPSPGAGSIWRSFATTVTPPRHPNPGNFANRPTEEMREIGRKGGKKGGKARGGGGFHNMDPRKQREIASKGGRASGGSFTKGSERPREAGRKGGLARGRSPFGEE
ncbi:hypothetical protein VTN77DRAFT_2693 [Rasamsonia byssochlamydoides]|uniref:uncharacterized protein n=1 Tax=Rasamsonia byssochlamydoides TaxID=89139 RepID=UPI0037438712